MSNKEQSLANASADEALQEKHVTVEMEGVHTGTTHGPVAEHTSHDYTIPKDSSASSPGPKKKNKGAHFFGIPPAQSSYTGTRTYNYTEKYAPDPLGDEFKENARVWKVYLDEAESYDDDMLRGFKDTIDSS
ncbi:hypothetical protein GYMLUDRAFT_253539 [Collybiopsis luxurians FD-317 M1]|uniref:Uncharacterized protein n=1 Tax=Collybiopsis luxurians FD-317 M1 TaxID=944289 RepID=A0A0D0B6W7_9AGAR|nr:hypothetical protein GYMLUDRAFT_253539 [Collybiopsis luxurians FD-317 M1]